MIDDNCQLSLVLKGFYRVKRQGDLAPFLNYFATYQRASSCQCFDLILIQKPELARPIVEVIYV